MTPFVQPFSHAALAHGPFCNAMAVGKRLFLEGSVEGFPVHSGWGMGGVVLIPPLISMTRSDMGAESMAKVGSNPFLVEEHRPSFAWHRKGKGWRWVRG